MIQPPLNLLVSKVDCRYTLVTVISKRARDIVEECSKNGEYDVKPVSLAVDDLIHGRIGYVHGRDTSAR